MAQTVKQSISNYDNGVREDSSLAPSYDKNAARQFINFGIQSNNPTNVERAPVEFGKSRFDKYLDLQYQPDKVKQSQQLEQLRSKEQSSIEQFGSAVGQAIVGEVVGGTIEGIGYYAQLLNGVNVTNGAGINYNNGLSKAGKQIREEAKRLMPIYQATDPDRNMLEDMTHWSWYMKQLPSVASTASLMLPGFAAVKAVGGLGKVLGLANKLNKAEKIVGSALLQSTVSRYGENAIEAGNVWDETYNKYKQLGKTEEDAKLAANKAAEYTFKANWAMLTQDFASALFMNIPGTKAATLNGIKAAQAMGVKTSPIIAKNIGNRALSAAGEGFEEAYQYIMSEEGKHYADVDMNKDNLNDPKNNNRFAKYLASKDLWTSALFGALGGAVAEFAFDNRSGEKQLDLAKAKQIAEMPALLKKMHTSQFEAEQVGTESAKRSTQLFNIAELAAKSSTIGNIQNIKDIMTNMKSLSVEDYTNILGEGHTNEDIAEFQKNITENLRHLEDYQKLYEKEALVRDPEIAANIAKNKFLVDKFKKEKSVTKAQLDSDTIDIWNKTKDITDNSGNKVGLTLNMRDYLQNNFIQRSSAKVTAFYENQLNNNKDLSDDQKQEYQKLLLDYKKETNNALKANKELYNSISQSEKEALSKIGKDATLSFDNTIQKLTSLTFLDKTIESLDKQISTFEKVKTVDEYNEKINTLTKSAIENIAKQKEQVEKDKLETERLRKVREEAIQAKESNELDKVNEIVDKISKGEQLISPEDLQIQANNPNLIEQGLIDKKLEEEQEANKDDLSQEPLESTENTIINEVPEEETERYLKLVEKAKLKNELNNSKELEVDEQQVEQSISNTLLEQKKLSERPSDTLKTDQIYVHDILWYNIFNTAKTAYNEGYDELTKLLNDPTFDINDIIKYGKFQLFQINKDVDHIGIAYNFKVRDKQFALYIKDADRETLKDKFIGREYQLDVAIEELKAQRSLIISKIKEAQDETKDNTFAFAKPVSLSLSNGIPNYSKDDTYLNVQEVFSDLFKQLFGELNNSINYNNINTNNIQFGIAYNFGTLVNSKLERIHNANVTNKGALYMLIPGKFMPSRQDEAVRLNVPYLKDIKLPLNSEFSDCVIDLLIQGVFTDPTVVKTSTVLTNNKGIKTGGVYRKYGTSPFTYNNLLKLFTNFGTQGTSTSNFYLDVNDKNEPILIFGEEVFDIASIITKSSDTYRNLKNRLDNKIMQVSLNKLDASLKQSLGFTDSKKWDDRWGNFIELPEFGLKITKDEFENLSYIGFLIKNNLIKTNLYKQQPFNPPYIYFQGVDVVKNVKETKGKFVSTIEPVDTAKSTSKKEATVIATPVTNSKGVLKASNILANTLGINSNVTNPIDNTTLTSEVNNENYIEGNITESAEWLSTRLGIKPNVTQGLINVAHIGKLAYGTFSKDGITLSTKLSAGTEYHEAFHRVSLLLLTDKERADLYKEVKDLYGFEGTVLETEEWLADTFKKYVLFGELPKQNKSKKSILKQVFDWFITLFKGSRQLNHTQLQTIFEGIQQGKFKNTKEQRSFKDIDILFNTDNSTLLTEVDGIKFNYIKSAGQFEEIVNNIFITTLALNNITALKGSIITIDFDKVKSKFEEIRDAFIEEKAEYQIGFYNEILDNFNLFVNKVQTELSNINFKQTVLEFEDSNKESDTSDVTAEGISEHTKTSYEINPQENTLAEIKIFLKTLPQVERTEMGELTAVSDPLTGLLKPIMFGKIWNQLMDDLHSSKNIEQHIKILYSKSNVIPVYEYIAGKLQNMPQQFKTQWLQTFNKHKHAMTNTLYEVQPVYDKSMVLENGEMVYTIIKTGDNITFKQGDANIQKPEKFYVKDWGNLFLNSDAFIKEPNKPIIVNTNYINSQIDSFNSFVSNFNVKTNNNRTIRLDINLEINKLVSVFNNVGINIDTNTLLHLLNDIDITDNISKSIIVRFNSVSSNGELIAKLSKYLTRSNNNINYLFNTTLKQLNEKGKVLIKQGTSKNEKELAFSDIYKNDSVVKELARYYSKDNPIASQSTTLGPDGNAVYQYAPNSYLTDVTSYIKTDEEYTNNLFNSKYQSGSYFNLVLNTYNDTQKSKFDILTALNFIEENSGDKGKGYLDMSPIEDYLFKMTNIQNGNFIVPTLADKKPYFMFTGIPTVLDEAIFGKDISFSDKVIDIFRNYLYSEIESIKDAQLFYEENKNNPNLLIKNYHTYKSNKFGEGNGMRFRHFADLNIYFENDEKRGNKTVLEVINEIENKLSDNEVLETYITKALRNIIKEEIKFASELGLINTDSTFTVKSLSNNLLDTNRLNVLKSKYLGNEGMAVYQMISEFTINNIIAINEFERIVSKDPAFYKDRDDVIKRLSAITSTGDALDNIAMQRDNYTSITLKDNEIPSAYIKVIHTKVYESLKDVLGEEKALEQANKVVESYSDVNQTDAQVYISPNMYKSILKGLGEWDDNIHGKAFDILENEEWEQDPELTKQALDVVMQPLKMVHFGDYFMSNMAVPMYDKMSLACLFKSLVKNTDLEPLYNRMNNTQLGVIDMVKFESAVKVGLNKPTPYYKDETMTEINDLTNVPTKTQDFKYLRRQLLTDPHHVTDAMLGTQVLKAAMSNINDSVDYTIDNITVKGDQLKLEYIESMKALSNKGKVELLNELGIEEKENGDYTINKPKLIEFLAKDAKSSGLPYNITDALKTVGNEFLLELAAHPDAAWIESRFTSIVNKKIIDTFMSGNAFIQMSNFGLKTLNSKSISRDSDDIKDLPSYGKNGELAIYTEEGYMEAAVSINLFKSVIPDYKNKSFEEASKWLLDNLDLTAMGYRIPTQGLSSISALKIVKVLPETTGDTIVLPAEFTKKTGSDFDIDKLYIARYNYEYNKDTNKVEKVKFIDYTDTDNKWLKNSKSAIQNRLLDCFMSVLKNPYHLDDTMMSLDRLTEILKKDIVKDLEKNKIKEPVKTFTYASPRYQSNKKYEYTGGKTGIGPFALNNVHHVLGQMTHLRYSETEFLKRHNMMNMDRIVGDDGEKILDWLSTLINAHVDVAKDPYIIKLNIVSYTYNMTNFLIRSGKGASTFYFLPQPIIKDLAKTVEKSKGNIGVDKSKKQADYEKEVISIYYKKLESLAKTNKEKDILKQFNDWIYKRKESTLNDDNLFNIDWLKETLQPSDTFKFYARQLLIGQSYLEMEKNYAKPLSDLVMASRIDTKKFGNSIIMQRQFVKQMNKVLNDFTFENADKLFEDTFLAEKARLSIGYKDNIGTLRKIFKTFLVSTTDVFIDSVDTVMQKVLKPISQDEVFVRNISKSIKSNIFAEFFNVILKQSNQTYQSMLYGDRSMAVRLDNLKKLIQTDDRLSNLKDNPLLDILTYDKVDSDLINTPSLLITPGARISDKNSKDMVTLGWVDMLTFTNSDEKIENAVQTFAKDLVNYAWLTSAGNPGPNSIYSYIPYSYLIDNGFNNFVKNKLQELNSLTNTDELLDNDFITNIFKNNWNNDNIVPHIKVDSINTISTKDKIGLVKINNVSYYKTLILNPKIIKEYNLGTEDQARPYFKIKIDKKHLQEPSYTILYKLTGFEFRKIGKKEVMVPVYNAVSKKGYFNKGKNVFEYTSENESNFDFNNIEEGTYNTDITDTTDYYKNDLLNKIDTITDEQANERKEQC